MYLKVPFVHVVLYW